MFNATASELRAGACPGLCAGVGGGSPHLATGGGGTVGVASCTSPTAQGWSVGKAEGVPV